MPLIKLNCPVQHYSWGKIGDKSLVYRLVNSGDKSLSFAELWVGAHPKFSASFEMKGSKRLLCDLIHEDGKKILGSSVVNEFGAELPFLFKILSIEKPLSIQLHPSRSDAKRLHEIDPKHYPDNNHKPEMAIAISEVTLLYGQRPFSEIQGFANEFNVFSELLSNIDLINGGKENNRRKVWERILFLRPPEVEQLCLSLYDNLARRTSLSPLEKSVLKMREIFPKGDPGLFAFFLMNYLTLKPGEAIFTPPGIPHAYLSGDLAECMACSDNVVRGGLTEKYVDKKSFLELLNTDSSLPIVLHSTKDENNIARYPTLVREFSIEFLDGSYHKIAFNQSDQVEIVFCLEGKGYVNYGHEASQSISQGDAVLIPASPKYFLENFQGKLFRVFVPNRND